MMNEFSVKSVLIYAAAIVAAEFLIDGVVLFLLPGAFNSGIATPQLKSLGVAVAVLVADMATLLVSKRRAKTDAELDAWHGRFKGSLATGIALCLVVMASWFVLAPYPDLIDDLVTFIIEIVIAVCISYLFFKYLLHEEFTL
jgi:hypothetical protein